MSFWRDDLRRRGGAVKSINLEAGDVANLAAIRQRERLASDSDAVSWALQVARSAAQEKDQ